MGLFYFRLERELFLINIWPVKDGLIYEGPRSFEGEDLLTRTLLFLNQDGIAKGLPFWDTGAA
jgi:hypothetical protein